MSQVKTFLRTTLSTARLVRYHRIHKRLARLELQKATRSGHQVSRATVRLCEEYASDIFGSRKYAPWLVLYSAISGKFKEGWIPDNFFGEHVVTSLQGNYGKISDLRALSSRLFGEDNFCDLAYLSNGLFVEHDRVISDDGIAQRLFKDGDEVIFKADRTSQSLGIAVFNEKDFDPRQIRQMGDGVFQRFLRQHPVLDQFAAGAVATLRLNTVLNEAGTVEIRSGHVRFAMKGDRFVKAANQIRVPIDLQTGELCSIGYDEKWRRLEQHPDTRISFAGVRVPCFSSCRDAVTSLHKSYPLVQIIGWDVAVSDQGQCTILEWNGWNNGLPFSEAAQGPCYLSLGWELLRAPQIESFF